MILAVAGNKDPNSAPNYNATRPLSLLVPACPSISSPTTHLVSTVSPHASNSRLPLISSRTFYSARQKSLTGLKSECRPSCFQSQNNSTQGLYFPLPAPYSIFETFISSIVSVLTRVESNLATVSKSPVCLMPHSLSCISPIPL